MDFTATVTDREIKPRIIHVKQYSEGTDRVIFTFEGEMPQGSPFIKNDTYKKQLTTADNTVIWSVGSEFTSQRGDNTVQLVFENGENRWLSYEIILAVSESEGGSVPIVPPQEGGYGVVCDVVGLPFAVLDMGIVGSYEVIN